MKLLVAVRCMAAVFALVLALPSAVMAAVIGSSLQTQVATAPSGDPVGLVIISFNDNDAGLTAAHVQVLRDLGIATGRQLPQLGMVAATLTAAQVQALAANAAVRSLYANDQLVYLMHQARVLSGVGRVETEPAFTAANNGLPLSGKGDFSIVVNDSGIDATHADLALGDRVVQNVQIVTDENTPNSVVAVDPAFYGFTPLTFVENVPNTDTNVGHGTHCAGIIGGNGVRSGALYRGVATGAKLIGCGSGAVEFVLDALGGFEWSLANQARYGIRVISNSWGGSGAFDPADPINVASKRAADRNIIVVFAAGNSGPAPDTMNPYAKAPWVIGVAAGTKEGGLASFSSRGVAKAQRLANTDPNDDFNAPTITAPGTGREFDTDASKFTQAIVSVRASTNLVANGETSDTEIPTGYIPFYTQISGTSMATPHVAGVVALLLEANPKLMPAQVKQILTATATRMPGYDEWEVGAGFVNAVAAVDMAHNLAAGYAPLGRTSWNAQVTVTKDPEQDLKVNYSPTATPGPDSTNAVPFDVTPGVSILEVTMQYGQSLEASLGNILILRLYAPDGSTYTGTGTILFVTDTPRRYVKVINPVPGHWVAEARGARGLSSVSQVSSPVALAVPDNVDFLIDRTHYTIGSGTANDISGNPYEPAIRTAIQYRYMDTATNGAFQPATIVNRLEFARTLADNAPLRQATFGTLFTDVATTYEPIAAAVTANGATLRHWDYSVAGCVAASGTQFKPNTNLTRMEAAIALVRALGYDAQAHALDGSIVTTKDTAGNVVAVADLLDIPTNQRGYAQLALDKGFVTPKYTSLGAPLFSGSGTITRAELASEIVAYRDFFSLQ
jgi:serine protease AprX